MQRLDLIDRWSVDIAKYEHVFKPIFPPTFVATVSFEFLCVLKGSEKNVPKGDVGKVVGMMTKLVMNSMRFRSLEDVSQPCRRIDIPMIKKFADGNEDCVV